MTVFDLIKNHYQEYLFKLKKIYPELLEFSKKVPIVPWKEEYSIADRNPEVITELKKVLRPNPALRLDFRYTRNVK